MRARSELGGELISASLYELLPGGSSCPYHYHYGEEELMIVLFGTPTLRGPDGERQLRAGDAVVFPLGPDGAHLLRNDGAEPARLIIFGSFSNPEVAVYPDSGKVGVWAGVKPDEPPQVELFVRDASPDARLPYWEGESDWVPPEEPPA